MMRFIVSVLATVAIFLAATAASATVTFTATGENLTTGSTDLSAAAVGDQIRIDVLMRADLGISGAGFVAFDFGGGAALQFDGGSAAATIFNKKVSATGNPLSGLANQSGTSNGTPTYGTDGFSIALPRSLGADEIQGDGAVRWFNGVNTTVATGNGSNDLGTGPGSDPLGSVNYDTSNVDYTGRDGDPLPSRTGAGFHAQLLFTVLAVGETMQVGVDGVNGQITDANGAIGEFVNASIQIGTVPEPGTALLMGLGLSGLSLAGRRRS